MGKKGLEKKKKLSLEPDSNQRPKDLCKAYYSPPLYQLSYQGNMALWERMCTMNPLKIGRKKKKRKKCSSGWFRSIDLWVMGPARFHCATLLLMTSRNENQYIAKNPRLLHDKWKISWKRKMSAQ